MEFKACPTHRISDKVSKLRTAPVLRRIWAAAWRVRPRQNQTTNPGTASSVFAMHLLSATVPELLPDYTLTPGKEDGVSEMQSVAL
jgi:hypothetical protein